MAADTSVPNTFVNATTADAPQVNANFAALVTWINTNAVHLDASKAFTGIPTGPATDPTTANQLTRKAYVDAKVWATANIAANAVTNAKLAQMATLTIKGNATGGLADPQDISIGATLRGLLSMGGVLAGTVNAVTYVAGSIQTADIADSAITSNKIAANTIVDADLAANLLATNIKGTKWTDYCGRVVRSGALNVATSSSTILVGNSEVYDYGNMHNTADGHITIPAGGVYHFDANVTWEAAVSVSGYRQIELRRYNSGGVIQQIFGSDSRGAGDVLSDYSQSNVSGDVLCATGDIVRIHVFQNSGSTINVDSPGFGVETCYSWHCVRLT